MISRSFAFLTYIYFFLSPFHGLIRTIGYTYGFPWLKGWKELLLLLLLILWLLSAATSHKRPVQSDNPLRAPASLWLVWGGTLTVGLLGVIVGAYHDVPLSQGFWGLKVEYLPLLWFLLLLKRPTLTGSYHLIRPETVVWGYAYLSIPLVLFGWWQQYSGWACYTAMLLGTEAYGVVAGSKFSHLAGVLRPISTFSEPPAFGGWCALVALCVLGLVLLKPGIKPIRRLFLYGVFFWCAFGTYLSTSRSSLLFLIVAIIALLSLEHFGNGKQLVAALVIVIPATALVITAHLIITLYQHGISAPLFATASTYERLSLWGASLSSFADGGLGTWLFGLGTGYAGVAQLQMGVQQWNFVDNTYLLLTLNHGFIGLLVWFCFLAVTLRYLIARIRDSQGLHWFGATLLAAWAGWLCEFTFRAIIEGYPAQAYLWGFTALAITHLPETGFRKSRIVTKGTGQRRW